jgi:hypothetical protein
MMGLLPMQSKHGLKTLRKRALHWRKKTGSVKSVHTPANVARVEGALQRSPTHSARWHAVSLGISDRSMKEEFTQRSPLPSV